MQPVFFCQQLFYRFAIHLIRDAAVDGANGGALGFFMEALTFCAFIGNDIISVDADGCIALAGVDGGTIQEGKRSLDAATVGDGPFHTTFVDGVIGALGLAGAAVDTFFCYLNSHFLKIRE
jgi:hypothetical protein